MTESCLRLLVAASMTLMLAGCRRPVERVLEIGTPRAYLECPEPAEWPEPVTRQVGSAGATLTLTDGSTLQIPSGAISGITRTVTLAPVRSARVGVDITMTPGGPVQPGKLLQLTIGTDRCETVDTSMSIWRIRNGQSQRLATRWRNNRPITDLETTSAYLIAN